MTFRLEEQGTPKLFVHTSRIPRGKRRLPLMEEDWAVLRYALYQSIKDEELTEMHEKFNDVTEKSV